MKFRRKADTTPASEDTSAEDSAVAAGPAPGTGPFDVSEVEGDGIERADLGSVLVPAIAEREGRWGTELVCQMPVRRPDGTTATQPSRIIGINGDRWMLRASFLGRPALDPDATTEWEDALAQIVVRRGEQAMPVGEPLPVTLPDDARRVR